MSAPASFDHVDYSVLDNAKNKFISASQRTLEFAKQFGFIPTKSLGASANIFQLDLKSFIAAGAESLSFTLVPEGLGTADDARPDDLSEDELYEFWFNIGIKTVSVMTNDAASAGMQPILLGLYLPSSTPEQVFTAAFMNGFLDGLVDGCKTVGCVYFSGETPQLKNKIVDGMLDIAGAVCGIVPPGQTPVNPSVLSAGDTIVLVESSGPHENGFTTFRALAPTLANGYRTEVTAGLEFWRAINIGSKLYSPLIQKVLASNITLSNIENITGHGWQKIMRPSAPFEYRITAAPNVLPVFSFVQQALGLSMGQMLRTFNCGSGMALFTHTKKEAQTIVEIASSLGLTAVVAGEVFPSKERRVVAEIFNETIEGSELQLKK